MNHRPTRSTRHRHPRRARRDREGFVMLVVMTIILIASGAIVTALNSATGEMRAAGQSNEAAWTRDWAGECTMGVVMLKELSMHLERPVENSLTAEWIAGTMPDKYGWPLRAFTTGPSQLQDEDLLKVSYFDGFENATGVATKGYQALGVSRDGPGNGAYASVQAQSSQPRCRALVETISWSTSVLNPGTSSSSQKRRHIITGIGETWVDSETKFDPTTGRGLHEKVRMSRAFYEEQR